MSNLGAYYTFENVDNSSRFFSLFSLSVNNIQYFAYMYYFQQNLSESVRFPHCTLFVALTLTAKSIMKIKRLNCTCPKTMFLLLEVAAFSFKVKATSITESSLEVFTLTNLHFPPSN